MQYACQYEGGDDGTEPVKEAPPLKATPTTMASLKAPPLKALKGAEQQLHTSAGQVETLRVKAPPTKEAMTQYAWRHSAPRVVKAVPVKEAPPLKAPPGVKAVPVKEAPPLKAAPTTEAPLKAPPAEPQKAPPLKALPLKAAHAMPMVHYLTVQALPVKAPPDEPMPALQCARTPPTTMPVPVTAPSTTTMPVPVTAPSSTAPMPAVPAKAPPALPRMPPNAAQGAEQLHILAGQVETGRSS